MAALTSICVSLEYGQANQIESNKHVYICATNHVTLVLIHLTTLELCLDQIR
jgi:hypothetical protein